MEGSAEGLELAERTRALAKRKRNVVDAARPAGKKVKANGASAHRKHPCTHKVACPEGFEPSSIQLDPAVYGTLENPSFSSKDYRKQYPFELDDFQAISVACLERQESVMVAAHTSAGKTVVAEYAIAKALQANQRVIYTSPLKALSNQKYRELAEEFTDVGLMTGDVSIREDAACIVMTTEILRSMLYRGSEMMREIAWVIFDEVHYMQDRERGVVWEETIITLPRAIRMVFLSATLSNAFEFAEWVASLHHQPCHVVSTDFRPTPLQHYAIPCVSSKDAPATGGMYMLCTKDGEFKAKMWEDLRAAGVIKQPEDVAHDEEGGGGKAPKGAKAGGDAPDGPPPATADGGKRGKKPVRDVKHISDRVVDVIRLAQSKELLPTIVFSFVRKECEQFAMGVWTAGVKDKDLDFTTAEEKESIEMIFSNAIANLSEDDRELMAVKNIKRYLVKGIGVHHGGLIPLLKEVVEILFQEGLIKILFATETFAMGLNLPARAVVFTSLTKFDGFASRFVTSGEYIQMSGRAGRRGKDKRGFCIMLVEDPDAFSPAVARNMVSGKPMPLLSSFKLSYYTLLNLMKRLEGGFDRMEYLIRHSFQQFQHEKSMPAWQSRLAEIEATFRTGGAGLTQQDCEEYIALRNELGACEREVQEAITQPEACTPFLKTGRLLHIREGATDWGWGVMITANYVAPKEVAQSATPQLDAELRRNRDHWQLVVLLCTDAASAENNNVPQPRLPYDKAGALDAEAAAKTSLVPIPVPLALVTGLGKDRIELPGDLRTAAARRQVLKSLAGLVARYGGPQSVAELHPLEDMAVKRLQVKKALSRMQELRTRLSENIIYQKEAGAVADQVLFEQFKALAVEREELKVQISRSQLRSFQHEVERRKKVLVKLGHCSADEVLSIKGKAAAEIDTADELLTSELMFNAVWKQLDKHKLVALLSCLVPCSEGAADEVLIPQELAGVLGRLQELAGHIADVCNECGLEVDKEKYVLSFDTHLMVPLYMWSKGSSFKQVTEASTIYEGTIIRCARRLMELMAQLITAAEKVGDSEMAETLKDALATIQRDIMFYGSLYL